MKYFIWNPTSAEYHGDWAGVAAPISGQRFGPTMTFNHYTPNRNYQNVMNMSNMSDVSMSNISPIKAISYMQPTTPNTPIIYNYRHGRKRARQELGPTGLTPPSMKQQWWERMKQAAPYLDRSEMASYVGQWVPGMNKEQAAAVASLFKQKGIAAMKRAIDSRVGNAIINRSAPNRYYGRSILP